MNCIICNTPNARRQQGDSDFARFDCPRCGAFALSGSAEAVLPTQLAEDPLRRSLMSSTLRRMHLSHDTRLRIISSSELSTFWSQGRLPTPQQMADALILWIGNNQPTCLDPATVELPALAATVGLPVMPNGDSQGLGWLFSQLDAKDMYRRTDIPVGRLGLQLGIVGWDRYETLKKANVESRTAFIAMKFGDATLDRVVENCFKPAVARTGFELRKLTDEQPAGLIDDQIRAAILSGRFVISDLTHGSHGAYWEAGFAEGLGRPVIYTCEKEAWNEKKTHFDTNHLLTIIWDGSDLEKAGNELTATIRATLRAEARQTDDT
jgi:hypothetical protein